jgi:lipoprotein-releasing system permease protein
MYRPLALYIGLRYTRAKRRNHFISVISLISMLGVALGVTALITVLSVMNGFEQELRARILGMASHAIITGFDERLSDWREVATIARDHPQVQDLAPYIKGEVMVSKRNEVTGTLLRGVVPEAERTVSDVASHMTQGEFAALEPGAFRVILGSELADQLRVGVGERITVITPRADLSPLGVSPRFKRFTVAGTFDVGMYEYDSKMAFIHLEDAATLFRLGDQVTGVRLELTDMFRAPQVVNELARQYDQDLWFSDWTRQHANFFRAIQMEKVVMFVILTLIVAVAAFNIVSTLVMLITDKEADIAILRTVGVTPAQVMGIFMVQGTLIGLVGTGLGAVGGIALALHVETIVPFLERLFQTQFLSGDVYYLTELPSELRWSDVTRVTGVAAALAVLATIYPAWRAARTQPAEALRYE